MIRANSFVDLCHTATSVWREAAVFSILFANTERSIEIIRSSQTLRDGVGGNFRLQSQLRPEAYLVVLPELYAKDSSALHLQYISFCPQNVRMRHHHPHTFYFVRTIALLEYQNEDLHSCLVCSHTGNLRQCSPSVLLRGIPGANYVLWCGGYGLFDVCSD